MLMFGLHVDFSLQLLILGVGVLVLVLAKAHENVGTSSAKLIGAIIILFAVVHMFFIAYYSGKFWSLGYFDKTCPMISMMQGKKMSSQMMGDRKTGDLMMTGQMMGDRKTNEHMMSGQMMDNKNMPTTMTSEQMGGDQMMIQQQPNQAEVNQAPTEQNQVEQNQSMPSSMMPNDNASMMPETSAENNTPTM